MLETCPEVLLNQSLQCELAMALPTILNLSIIFSFVLRNIPFHIKRVESLLFISIYLCIYLHCLHETLLSHI